MAINICFVCKRDLSVTVTCWSDFYFNALRKLHTSLELDYYQSNIEGEIIDKLHEVGFEYDGIVLNAGAYTHTSIAIGDAVKAITTPVVEVHISNVYSREEFRHISHISSSCVGIISGFGLYSYNLAIDALVEIKGDK